MEASERRLLAQEASNLGITLSEEQLARLAAYASVLLLWNRKVRLLGDRDPRTLVRKHIPDCLALVPFLPTQGPVADVGTGAGLPGLVLACARPDLEYWLVESRSRRVSFLHDAVARIGLPHARVLGIRLENLVRDDRFAGKAMLVTARAVAASELLGHGRLLMSRDGRLALMQSQRQALENMEPLAASHGLRLADVRTYRLGTGESRRIVVLARA